MPPTTLGDFLFFYFSEWDASHCPPLLFNIRLPSDCNSSIGSTCISAHPSHTTHHQLQLCRCLQCTSLLTAGVLDPRVSHGGDNSTASWHQVGWWTKRSKDASRARCFLQFKVDLPMICPMVTRVVFWYASHSQEILHALTYYFSRLSSASLMITSGFHVSKDRDSAYCCIVWVCVRACVKDRRKL